MPYRHEDDLDDSEYPDESDLDDDETEPCPYCGVPVYDDSVRCPSCGGYLSVEEAPRRYPWWFVAGFLLSMVVALGWALRLL